MFRIIISKGVTTVLEGGELERLMQDNQRIWEQGQQIIQQNNATFDRCQQLIDNMNGILNHTSNIPAQTSNGDWLQQFIERGTVHSSGQQGIFNQDYWANFVVGVIKKSLWLLWNSFIGIAHWLCILAAVAGIIAFIAGWKKGGVVSICSILFYILIKLINMALGG